MDLFNDPLAAPFFFSSLLLLSFSVFCSLLVIPFLLCLSFLPSITLSTSHTENYKRCWNDILIVTTLSFFYHIDLKTRAHIIISHLTTKYITMAASTPMAPLTALQEDRKNLLLSGEYSDMKIVCQGVTFNVHRSIICPSSSFFTAIFKHPCQVRVDCILTTILFAHFITGTSYTSYPTP